jgi:hypothetical protein
MNKCVCRCELYQDGGAGGARGQIETTNSRMRRDVIAWARGQIGWPWDGVLATLYSRDDEEQRKPLRTLQISLTGKPRVVCDV